MCRTMKRTEKVHNGVSNQLKIIKRECNCTPERLFLSVVFYVQECTKQDVKSLDLDEILYIQRQTKKKKLFHTKYVV